MVKSCGVIVFRGAVAREFLLMRHADRWDLPKGHVDEGETEIVCALRELHEETGISADDVRLDPVFRFVHDYTFFRSRDGQPVQKRLVVFLADLVRDVQIHPTEHGSFAWFAWRPPHDIQRQTIDPLLAAVERHYAAAPTSRHENC